MTASGYAPPDQTSAAAAMTAGQRARFERDGYLLVPGVLSPAEVGHYASVLDRVYRRHAAAGRLAADGSLHRLSAAASAPELADLVAHPKAFGLVWSVLGWNIHVYHSHLDVHPPVRMARPFRFEWHQDGGRQNRELESDPRPRLSVKLAFWLSDVSRPGRGNFQVVPGSHLTNRIDGPPRRDVRWPDPPGAVQVCAAPGDAVFFDRRIWHARSDNRSALTRPPPRAPPASIMTLCPAHGGTDRANAAIWRAECHDRRGPRVDGPPPRGT